MRFWTYRHAFTYQRHTFRVEAAVTAQALRSRVYRDDQLLDEQELLFAAGYQNAIHQIGGPEGSDSDSQNESGAGLTIEVGYISLWVAGVQARVGDSVVFESHPGRDIRYGQNHKLLNSMAAKDPAEAQEAVARWHRNKYSVYADLGLGALFFIVGKVTGDLVQAAVIGALAGLALVVLQRFVKVDLLGGFAIFGTIMLLVSAGFSLAFQSEFMVQMKSTILGTATALLFFGDGLFRKGRYFGARMQRYMPTAINTSRMALGLGMLGVFMAAANYLVAILFSEDAWLTYTTFLDMPLSIGLAYAVFFWARAGVEDETVAVLDS